MIYSRLEIKKIRKKADLTQKEFAKSLNVSLASIQKWESGERIPTEQMCFYIKQKYNVGNSDAKVIKKDISENFIFNNINIPDNEIIKYLTENEDRLLKDNKILSLWLKTKVQEGIIMALKS